MNIPICPKCLKPTRRQQGGMTCTAMYIPTVYDKQGNIEPSSFHNTVTTEWQCLECGHFWAD